MIKGVIFDFFDVIRSDGFNRWRAIHGISNHETLYVITDKHDRGDIDDQEFFSELGAITGQTAAEVEAECESNNTLNTELVEYIAELGELGYKTALLSNSNSAYLRKELATYELEPLFDEITISSEVKLIKPEVAIFEHILGKLSLDASECIFTDDNQRHINGAAQAHIRGILFTGTADFKRQFEAAVAETHQ